MLEGVSVGISAGQRIGVVGRNGDGKSTLLQIINGTIDPDRGLVTTAGDLDLKSIAQADDLDDTATIRQELVHGLADHEWAADPRFREVLDGLIGGVSMDRFPDGLDTQIAPLSGGERRRIALAKLLLGNAELLLLDEPTNHLDVEGVAWLAHHLARRKGSLVVVTHDRWFLDAVCTDTWEVSDGKVYQYEGGYAAFVLARAERDRQAQASDARRRNLLRKELAWLRRGPPARTTKPKFRIDAANALIADEPEVRDRAELLRFASARLGKKVLDVEDVSVTFGDRPLLRHLTWRLGPGDRVALVGVNGSGKTSLMRLLAGELEADTGSVSSGQTVRLAYLSQNTTEVPGHMRVLEAVESVRLRTKLGDGREMTAGMMCERFGFKGPRGRTLVSDLSGGERRRLQLMRLLMDEPNVLLLDEPTNDLDVDTLRALEEALVNFAGCAVVISHDRWFLDRIATHILAFEGDSKVVWFEGNYEAYEADRKKRLGAEADQPHRIKYKPLVRT